MKILILLFPTGNTMSTLQTHTQRSPFQRGGLPSSTTDGGYKALCLLQSGDESAKSKQANEKEHRLYLENFFRELRANDRAGLSKAEIDQYLAEERANWND